MATGSGRKESSTRCESGRTACFDCTAGEYCTEGAAAGLPCPSGRYQNVLLAVMTSVDDCIGCPAGSSCSTGAAEPTECSPGTVPHTHLPLTPARCGAGMA